MVDLKTTKEGDKVIWLGCPKRGCYGQRSVPAVVIRVHNGKIHIKITTPNGEIKKYVHPNSLDYAGSVDD